MRDDPTVITTKPSAVGKHVGRLAGAVLATAVIVAGTTGALWAPSLSAERTAQRHTISGLESAHVEAAASLRNASAASDRGDAVALAETEIARAESVLASSKGKAAPEGRTALQASIASAALAVASGSAYEITNATMSLREAEKAVTDSVAAWEQARKERLAEQAAARAAAARAAAARAAAEYSTADTHGPSVPTRSAPTRSSSSSSSPANTGGSSTPPAKSGSSTPYFAPGVPHERPDNTGCGPCPGATLVLTPQGYWGCP